ncbi:MAG: recombinase family protein [Planctomycetota bacterium]
MKNAVIYTRFSPRPGADECKSNERQEERCRAYCERRGYQVKGVYPDVCVSGAVLCRPGLTAALAALEPGDVLVVDTSDRLARDMLVSLTIRHQVDCAGCALEFADGSPTHTTPEGKLFANMLAAFAAYERDKIARRTKAGLARKRDGGMWLGKPPIGYRFDRKTKRLVPEPREQEALALIRLMVDSGATTKEIADSLTEHCGLLRGKPWTERTVRKVLARQEQRN